MPPPPIIGNGKKTTSELRLIDYTSMGKDMRGFLLFFTSTNIIIILYYFIIFLWLKLSPEVCALRLV